MSNLLRKNENLISVSLVTCLLLALVVCAATGCAPSQSLQIAPESWSTLDVAAQNGRIEEAVLAAESWPKSPLMIAIHLLGGDSEARTLKLEEIKNRGEGADATTIMYIRDGFLDDSVRGNWYELDLHRLPDGTWRMEKARVAIRCWRAENRDLYQAEPCP